MKNHRYQALLSPIRIGNIILKDRICTGRCNSQELQGPETFPSESTTKYITDLARNGSAMVTMAPGDFRACKGTTFYDSPFDIEDRRVQSYLNRLVERVHAYGSLALCSIMGSMPMTKRISDTPDHTYWHPGLPGQRQPEGYDMDKGEPLTKEGIQELIEMLSDHCVYMKNIGFDGVNIYSGYDASILANSLSPVHNQRTDEYGGSLENRCRTTVELFRKIKEKCGQDFLIQAKISGEEGIPGGYTNEDFIEICRQWEGLVDIYMFCSPCMDPSSGGACFVDPHNPPTLKYSEQFKAAGIKGIANPSGMFHDMDDANRFIAEGKADLIDIARPLICDPEFYQKLLAERGEDLVPCLCCDKCHGAICSANPRMGLSHVFDTMFEKNPAPKKVGVIGGGPAGMMAAITAGSRGHQVKLYEASGQLGGQMIHTDYLQKKWNLSNYKRWMIHTVETTPGVEILLNTRATPEMIASEGFDALIVALGSKPKKGLIPGDETAYAPTDIFGKEAELGKKVTVIGGAMAAVDAALYLAETGHEVTILTRQRFAGYDYHSHGAFGFIMALAKMGNPAVVTEVQVKAIEDGKVIYTDKEGVEHFIECDNVIASEGRDPMVEETMAFAGLTPIFRVVGDTNRQESAIYGMHEGSFQNVPVSYDIRHATYTGAMAAYSI